MKDTQMGKYDVYAHRSGFVQGTIAALHDKNTGHLWLYFGDLGISLSREAVDALLEQIKIARGQENEST